LVDDPSKDSQYSEPKRLIWHEWLNDLIIHPQFEIFMYSNGFKFVVPEKKYFIYFFTTMSGCGGHLGFLIDTIKYIS
jgi:hypothetical protein